MYYPTTRLSSVHFQTHHAHLPELARYLIGLNLPFVIHHPPELRETLLQLAEQLVRIAKADKTSG